MKRYRITWQKISYSYVNAESEKEAIEKANDDQDYDWEEPEIDQWVAVSAEFQEEEEE